MKYETVGGEIKDTIDSFTLLRFLKLGDRFKTKSNNHIWEVWDERCNWNGQAGSPTRKCKNLTVGGIDHKLCRIEVIKIKMP